MCTDCGCAVPGEHRHLPGEGHDHDHGHSHSHSHSHSHGHMHDHAHGHGHGHGATEEAAGFLDSLMAHNDAHARTNRARLDRHRILTINLMSSPGSGKTALLEATIRALQGSLRIAVIEGDLETENDAERIRALGVPAQQITTGTACHLDAHLVGHALEHLDLDAIDLLFIENVGNLVCPASFDLGQHRNVILLSVTEGDDKPAKYPVMFRAADLMLLAKTDLLPYLDEFSPARAERCLRELASPAPVLPLSAKSGAGLDAWIAWLQAARAEHGRHLEQGESLLPVGRNAAQSRKGGQQPEISFSAAG
ncbi:hydrogenase nickel incorporation protein HypB [Rhodocyclus purpureus]|uniref:hydrogenase nickel incorporation protein HypB n=1 Tax=Rhodocyclus purpureus TaxID=1067 RepID=UPI0019127F14|nr:hydrogenase nickel incorporation protein HypB [Rhodocyclus purpureus]MBK5914900.1 hydrogenase accessory protein HypB [Rhodocyclus purpureus]